MPNATFRANFAKLIKRAGNNAQIVVRKVAIDLGQSLVSLSPVDTGRFKNNWVPGTNAINAGTTVEVDPSGSAAMANINAAAQEFKVGDIFYITNSLPYARALEYGHSKQAPHGMVRITVISFKQNVRRAVNAIR